MFNTIQFRFTLRRRLASLTLGSAIAFALSVWGQEVPTKSAADEILRHVKRLASSELTGRGVDTPGIKLARDYIAGEFAAYGLKPGGENGTYLQGFDVTVGVKVKQPSELNLARRLPLKLDDDWIPLGLSSNGSVEAPLVFAGYGISAKDHGYDDYENVDVKGKVVLVLRYEPPPQNSKSPFRKAPDYSNYATLRSKANNARAHGALAMILVDLNHRDGDGERLITTRRSLARRNSGLIAAQVKSTAMERFLDSHGIQLKSLREEIDRQGKPNSRAIANVSVKLQVTLDEIREPTANVIAVLPGADPALADQTILIGAHYDHLGFGHFGARSANAAGEIHYGADDNASGTAVLLDLSRRLSQLATKPARTIVFAAFSAEELGLFGSRHFVEESVSLAKVKAMINLDMVGRLRDNRLTVFGARSGAGLVELVDRNAVIVGLALRHSDNVGRSDHLSFYNKKVPVLHFSTGVHEDYHRPSDTWEKLNIEGMAKVSDLSLRTALNVANAKEALHFVSLPARPPSTSGDRRGPVGVYLGTMPDYGSDSEGVRIAGITVGSPAALAGLREGDVIIKLADNPIQNIDDLTDVLSSRKPGDEVEIIVLRMNEPLKVKATLKQRS